MLIRKRLPTFSFNVLTGPFLQQHRPCSSRVSTRDSGSSFEYEADSGATTTVTVRTVCGRTFDSTVFRQVTKAMEDQRWVEAIQKSLQQDKEYMEMLKEKGGSSQKVRKLLSQHNDGRDAASEASFMGALRVELMRDTHLALCLCALQDAYTRIRRKRDAELARRMAENTIGGQDDPMTLFKKSQNQFVGKQTKPPIF